MVTSIKGNATSTFGSDIDVTGNVITDAPVCRAYLSVDQSITTATVTKIQFDAKTFDTTSDFDSTTNYRYTPSVAGYYQVNTTARSEGSSLSLFAVYIYKNGSRYVLSNLDQVHTTSIHLSSSALIYCNGTTDYIEIYGRIDGTSPQFGGDSDGENTIFEAFLARAA